MLDPGVATEICEKGVKQYEHAEKSGRFGDDKCCFCDLCDFKVPRADKDINISIIITALLYSTHPRDLARTSLACLLFPENLLFGQAKVF